MKDPDQPELDDPRRKEYDFQQARAAQVQMASGTFGEHHSAILPDGDGQKGESKKSRLEAMISDAVKSAVTQITTNVMGAVEMVERPFTNTVGVQADSPATIVQQQVVQPQMPNAVQAQGEPIIVQQPGRQAVQYQTPQMPELAGMRTPTVEMVPPTRDETDAPRAALPPIQDEPRGAPLPFMDRLAMPNRVPQDFRVGFRVEQQGDAQVEQEAPQRQPQREAQRAVPDWPADRAAWGSREPFLDPGGKTADPQRSAYQSKSIEQGIEFSEAMDSYGMVMSEFAEAVTESIRVLTRRVNDMTRAIQGEGYDLR